MRADRYLVYEDGLEGPEDFGLAAGPDDPGVAEPEGERKREAAKGARDGAL